MDLSPVESSMIQALGYDPGTKTLAVQFRGTGDVWHYADVPEETYELLHFPPSMGGAFARLIRGRYEGTKQPRQEEVRGG